MNFRTIDEWSEAKFDLGIDVEGPKTVQINGEIILYVDLIVKNFGGPKGTIVVNDYDRIGSIKTEIRESGYSWSYIAAPSKPEPYDREVTIDVLLDWGWSGPVGEEPNWYKDGLEKHKNELANRTWKP